MSLSYTQEYGQYCEYILLKLVKMSDLSFWTGCCQ
jgi:hypothetical protein